MNLSVGRQGEDRATAYLASSGYCILHRNYRTKAGEIDIVAEKNGTIYFVEVKTRTGDRYGKPYEAVTYSKRQHMLRAAQWYVLQNNLQESKLRLAVVSIQNDGGTESIRMYDLD